jgi:futalosine hydrolase
MKILIAAATPMEIKMFADEMNFVKEKHDLLKSYQFFGNEIDILMAGIGTVATTYRLTNTLNKTNYDLVMNIGIAGSLNHVFKIGDVVNVVTEEFADMGIEKREKFLTLFETGFIDENEFPFENGLLKAPPVNQLKDLKEVHGITTNRSHGNSDSIAEIRQKFGADIETMEGAAVFYVCLNMSIPCCQIRAISNYVEPRDSSNWDIPLALENLKTILLSLFNNINMS